MSFTLEIASCLPVGSSVRCDIFKSRSSYKRLVCWYFTCLSFSIFNQKHTVQNEWLCSRQYDTFQNKSKCCNKCDECRNVRRTIAVYIWKESKQCYDHENWTDCSESWTYDTYGCSIFLSWSKSKNSFNSLFIIIKSVYLSIDVSYLEK